MPQGSTVQQFWPECNVYVFAGKLVDSIYRGPGNKCEIIFTGLSGQEFSSECKDGVLALRLLHSTYKGPGKKRKNIKNKQKNSVKFRTRMPQGLTVYEVWSECKGGVFALKL